MILIIKPGSSGIATLQLSLLLKLCLKSLPIKCTRIADNESNIKERVECNLNAGLAYLANRGSELSSSYYIIIVLGRDSHIHDVSMLEHEPSNIELHEAMELAAYGYSLIMRMTFQKGLVAAR